MSNKIENIIFFGDIHGEISQILNYVKKNDLRNTVFIAAGDFGIGFEKSKEAELKILKYFNIPFTKRNIKIYAVRGNHDNPSYYNENFKYGSFTFLSDYQPIIINGLKILPLGGAISVDRNPNVFVRSPHSNNYWKGRKLNTNYWIDEPFQYKPELLKHINDIDIVVSHNAPDFCFPYKYNNIETWCASDKTLLVEVTEERENLTKIYNLLLLNGNKLKYWFYGHFHNSNTTVNDNTQFILLDVNEFFNLNIPNYES